MVIEVGEYFEEEFNREFEYCATHVRCWSEEQVGIANIHLRWFEPEGSFGPLYVWGGLPSTSALAASLSRTERKKKPRMTERQ